MTETEAKTKWCPFVRVAYTDACGDSAVNRVTSDDGHAYPTLATQCFGSACMAWREDPNSRGRGYCGLAGRPE